MTIFISIAAYRDPELNPTLKDCIAKARWPGDLRFGICWQHADREPKPMGVPRKQLRLLDVPWRESQGACWARAEIMKLYDGENWFLQLDSHHRFVQDWDVLLIDQADRSGAEKPLLTTYAADQGFGASPAPFTEPTRMTFAHFTPEGVPMFDKTPMPDWQSRTAPMRARFLSAHLLFAPGSFVSDVPYDPDLYFFGEESTLAIRAFTHGYSLFHPSVHVVWHQCPRPAAPKHWDDHVAGQGAVITAQERDRLSLARANRFFTAPKTGLFGCGTERSFADYETYAGLNFRRRYASLAARRGDEPAPPQAPLRDFHIRIALDRTALPQAALDRPQFWYVGFHDASGAELARHDAASNELQHAVQGDHVVIERRISAPRPPARWTVWPTDRRGRWLEAISGPVDTALTA